MSHAIPSAECSFVGGPLEGRVLPIPLEPNGSPPLYWVTNTEWPAMWTVGAPSLAGAADPVRYKLGRIVDHLGRLVAWQYRR